MLETGRNSLNFRTPGGGPKCADHEITVRELANGSIEVHDPLLDAAYRIGDGSLITDPTADAIVLASWRQGARHLSTRQLSNTEPYTTKTGTDRWSRKGHELSVAAMTARFGGTPEQIIAAALHDEGHRLGSHRTDDLLSGRGSENTHDTDLLSYLQRSGFTADLQARGLLDERGVIPAYGLGLADIVDHDEAVQPPGFTNQPGRSGSLEVERLQYIGQEALIWIYEPQLVREAVRHARRATHPVHGEHIVFDDAEAARLIATAQVRCATEHWAEPFNDLVDECIMTADRRLLTTHASNVQLNDTPLSRYYPGDVLYAAEEDWQELSAARAEKDPFLAAVLKIAGALARQQRRVHDSYDHDAAYNGPQPPTWLMLHTPLMTSPHMTQGIYPGVGQNLRVELRAGKARAIDPWVVSVGGLWRRLSEINPATQAYRQRQSRWLTNDNLVAVVDYSSPRLALSPQEKRAIAPGLRSINQEWPAALRRPLMPTSLLTQYVSLAGFKTRQRARHLSVAAASTEQVTSERSA